MCFCILQFVGAGGSGKTFQINRTVAAMPGDRHIITVRVNEGFSVAGMVDRLTKRGEGSFFRALAQGLPLTFVFHVSAFAPFPEAEPNFDSFLFSLFVTRCLAAPGGASVLSLPHTANVQILLEVPNPVPVHDAAADARGLSAGKKAARLLFEGTVSGGGRGDAPRPVTVVNCPCEKCLKKVLPVPIPSFSLFSSCTVL